MNLNFLANPMNAKEFLFSIFEQKPFFFPQNNSAYLQSIFCKADLDLYLSRDIPLADIRVVKSEGTIAPALIARPGSAIVNIGAALDAFASGYSITLHNILGASHGLTALIRSLENSLLARVEPNLYLTPENSQGFKTHWDNHDVFILQVFGSKKWHLFAPIMILPNHSKVLEPSDSRNETWNGTLSAGDILYIPRGVPHHAITTNESSCHVTLTISTQKNSHFLHYLLDDLVNSNIDLRRSLVTNNDSSPALISKAVVEALCSADNVEKKYKQYIGRYSK